MYISYGEIILSLYVVFTFIICHLIKMTNILQKHINMYHYIQVFCILMVYNIIVKYIFFTIFLQESLLNYKNSIIQKNTLCMFVYNVKC